MTSQMVDIHTPDLNWWLNHLETSFSPVHSVELFIQALKRRSVRGPTPAAVGTAQLLLRLVSQHKISSIHSFVEYILSLETRLSAARPREMSIRNMVRRVLGIIREEAENMGLGEQFKAAMEAIEAGEKEQQQHTTPAPAKLPPRAPLLSHHASFSPHSTQITSLFSVLSRPSTPQTSTPASTPPQSGYHTPVPTPRADIRPAVIQDIQELIEEIESCEVSLADNGAALIHKNEVLLTYGLTPVIQRLLLRAAHILKKDHPFTVVVVEGSPNILSTTHSAIRNSLQEKGIQVIVISDGDIPNIISRINKVFLAAHYVLADGAVLADSGAMNVVRSAAAFRKPVVVVAGSHTLCPVLCFDRRVLVEMGPPVTVGYDEGELLEKVDFPNPLVDYIEPRFVTMFVSNNGTHAPTTINRATLELYHMSEADLI